MLASLFKTALLSALFLPWAALAADFNVRAFGAVADGAADSTRAIQAAIDAAAKAGGGTVIFPPAPLPYLVHDTLAIRGGNMNLSGFGATIRLADGAINDGMRPVLLVGGTEQAPLRDVAIRGLTIDANYFAQTKAKKSKAVVFRFVENALAEDMTIVRAYVGLSLRRCKGATARRVTISDYQEDAFDTGGDADEVSGGVTTGTVFIDVIARDAPRAAKDGNAFEIEDGAHGVLIENALVENVSGNGVGLRNHPAEGNVNHSRDVELRNVRIRRVGGFAVFARSAPASKSANNSYRNIRLVNLVTDGAVLFWGPIRNLRLTGGHYADIHIGFDEIAAGPALPDRAVADARLENLEADVIRINSSAGEVVLSGTTAKSILRVRAR